jgi:hypothetical protein
MDLNGRSSRLLWFACVESGRPDREGEHTSDLTRAAEVGAAAGVHLLVVTEAGRIWAAFSQILPRMFPQVPRMTAAGTEVLTTSLAGSGPITLYERKTQVPPP